MQNIPALNSPRTDALRKHYRSVSSLHMRAMFAADPARAKKFVIQDCGLLVDYSKNRALDETMDLLIALAEQAGLEAWRHKLFGGEKVNASEQRGATHTQMRSQPATAQHRDTLSRLRQLSRTLRAGEKLGHSGKPIRDVVCIGIGGSHIGCAMACRAIATGDSRVRVHFVAAVGGNELQDLLAHLDPERTLFVVTSKSFSSWESKANARYAREWVGGAPQSVAQHFIAISGSAEAVARSGILAENRFLIPATVGGRYSLCSAAGLPFAIHAGMDAFAALLAGAKQMDDHFCSRPLRQNIPVILSLLDIWYGNFFGAQSRAVLSYIRQLELFPVYLQQLEMESNGKRVSRDGEALNYSTAPVVWGGMALEGQHSFGQLLHQGTQFIPIDFIASAQQGEAREQLYANFLAQSHLLMNGRDDPDPQKHLPGNRPNTALLMRELTPETLGALIALYEHKVFCNAVIWNINPFDQWGVAAGKALSAELFKTLQEEAETTAFDASTNALIGRYYK